jgi:hypothetical protein
MIAFVVGLCISLDGLNYWQAWCIPSAVIEQGKKVRLLECFAVEGGTKNSKSRVGA